MNSLMRRWPARTPSARRFAAYALGVVLILLGLSACHATARTSPSEPAVPGGEAFVFSSEGANTTSYWLADPARPSVRRLIKRVAHEAGWPGNAAVSPDGQTIAYTMLPAGSRDADHEAQLATLGLSTGRTQVVARGIDLRSTLVWTGDSKAVTLQRYDGNNEQLWLQPQAGGSGGMLAEAPADERLIPVGARPEGGEILVADYRQGSVDLLAVRAGEKATTLTHMADGLARDIEPDATGDQLAFLATGASDDPTTSRGYVLRLSAAGAQMLPLSWGEIVGVAWSPDGRLTAGSAGPNAALRSLDGSWLRTPALSGFAQPLSWSPSGHYLAVRLFSGASAEQPGAAREAILSTDGGLLAITDSDPVRFVGWLAQDGVHAAH